MHHAGCAEGGCEHTGFESSSFWLFRSRLSSSPFPHIPFSRLRVVSVSVGLLQHREIMAGLRFEPERYTGIVLCHHLVQEASGLRRNALAVCFTL